MNLMTWMMSFVFVTSVAVLLKCGTGTRLVTIAIVETYEATR